jgi:hypothetical protein
MNIMKKRPKHKKMTSAGRVFGFGLTMKVDVHFKEESKARKERRSKVEEARRLKIADLKAQVAALPAQMEEKFEARLRQVIPPQLWEGRMPLVELGRYRCPACPAATRRNTCHRTW